MVESSSFPRRDVSGARVIAVRGDDAIERLDRLAGEEPMEIAAAGPGQARTVVAVTMRTPGHDEELAAGFLFTEGLVGRGDVAGFEMGDPGILAQPQNEILVRLGRPFDASAVSERHFIATASCGICGKASLDEVALRSFPVEDGPVVGRSTLLCLPAVLRADQEIFEATGGLHASGLFDPAGRLMWLREDVGRHNALDKLVGRAVLDQEIPLLNRILLVSGRVSFEIVQKAAAAGIPIICAVSAPTDLAVEAAQRFSQTLVGFLRGDGFNIYSRPDRIDLAR